MNQTLEQIEALIRGLSYLDFVNQTTGEYKADELDMVFSKFKTKLAQMRGDYGMSGYYTKFQIYRRSLLDRAQEARDRKKEAAYRWCEANLKPGMWVRVTGTKSSLKNRKVLGLQNGGFVNCGGDPLTDKVHYLTTWTGFASVSHVFNPTTRIMEKMSVLISNSGTK